MGTASGRSGSHPVLLAAVAAGSVQVTVIEAGLIVPGYPFPFSPVPILASLAGCFRWGPRSGVYLSLVEPCGFYLFEAWSGSAVTLRFLLSPVQLHCGPFIARLKDKYTSLDIVKAIFSFSKYKQIVHQGYEQFVHNLGDEKYCQ